MEGSRLNLFENTVPLKYKVYRPTQYLNATQHCATCFSSSETSSDTSIRASVA